MLRITNGKKNENRKEKRCEMQMEKRESITVLTPVSLFQFFTSVSLSPSTSLSLLPLLLTQNLVRERGVRGEGEPERRTKCGRRADEVMDRQEGSYLGSDFFCLPESPGKEQPGICYSFFSFLLK